MTFLMGTYKGVASLGAHSWSSAKNQSGAAWADMYINPDGAKTLYIGKYGGTSYTPSANIMRIDNSSGRVGIGLGATAPTEKLEVSGNINISTGSKYKINGTDLSAEDVSATPKFAGITAVTTNITMSTSHVNHVLYVNGSRTITIPTGFTNGSQITIINEGTGTITINPDTDVNINNDTVDLEITDQRKAVTLLKYKDVSTTEYWFAIGI